MKCYKSYCNKESVIFHGLCSKSQGYCEEHRCCSRCGMTILKCDCKEGFHTERLQYLEVLFSRYGYSINLHKNYILYLTRKIKSIFLRNILCFILSVFVTKSNICKAMTDNILK